MIAIWPGSRGRVQARTSLELLACCSLITSPQCIGQLKHWLMEASLLRLGMGHRDSENVLVLGTFQRRRRP